MMPRLSMKDNHVRQNVVGLLLSLSLAVGAAHSTFAQGTVPPRVTGEGRLYNLTSRPFTFQLHRRDGVKWTDGYVVQPGKFFSVKVPTTGQRDDILGISGNGQGFVIVRFREPTLGGFMTLRLPATNPASLKLEPTWFAVEDANGNVRLVQEASVEKAQATQEALKKQTPMTPAELENMKQTLRNNWVLTN
jgi:hypothetical protein